jgi:hypothetical protein
MSQTRRATSKEAAERERGRLLQLARERAREGKEIGPLPKCRNRRRKNRCKGALRLFAETYFAHRLWWPFSPSHLDDLRTLQRCAEEGGLFAFARPRGEGKTTLAEITALYATAYGFRRYPLIVAANDKPLAADILKSLQRELEREGPFADDFPEICFPMMALEGAPQRAGGQTVDGERTRPEFSREGIRLATVRRKDDTLYESSGAVIECVGMSAAIRGRKSQDPDGRPIRPDLILLDDPQTRESARSPTQIAERLSIIRGDVLGLAGPDVKIAVVMPCTVIYPGDLADQLLDRQKNPQWQGRRTKRLISFPKNMDLWKRYKEVRDEGLRQEDGGKAGNEFYLAHRAEMDEGAAVSWEARVKDGDVSAIQGAMTHFLEDPTEFFAEDQNEPVRDESLSELRQLSEADLEKKLNGLARGVVPRDCNLLTAFVDVQEEVLYWYVSAWSEKFGGATIDYGAFPPQPRPMFDAADPPARLSARYPGMDLDARLYSALAELVPLLFGRAYTQDQTGAVLTISACTIDQGYKAQVVHDFVSRSPHRPMLKASAGRGIGASSKPLNAYRKEPADRVGWNWRIDAVPRGGRQHILFDTNSWKTFCVEGLLAPPGAVGSLYLFGSRLQVDHPLLTVHLLSEYRIPTFGMGRRVEEWKIRPNYSENHWFDGLVGSAVTASERGLKWSPAEAAGAPPEVKPERKRLTYREQRARLDQRDGQRAARIG